MKIITILESKELELNPADFDITMDTPSDEIISKLASPILESHQVDISQLYMVKKMVDTDTIYLIPKSTAG